MMIRVALLRGINVGKHNRVKIEELKIAFEAVGLKHVQTYIQSGNVLFASNEEDDQVRTRIEREIAECFGVSTTAVLRSARELEQIVESCPFSPEEISAAEGLSEGESLYVCLLPNPSSPEEIHRLSAFRTESDQFRVIGRDVYLLLRQGVRNSKLASNLQKLDPSSTMRNWKTTRKLATLAKDLELDHNNHEPQGPF